jgi:hypothetical protein
MSPNNCAEYSNSNIFQYQYYVIIATHEILSIEKIRTARTEYTTEGLPICLAVVQKSRLFILYSWLYPINNILKAFQAFANVQQCTQQEKKDLKP